MSAPRHSLAALQRRLREARGADFHRLRRRLQQLRRQRDPAPETVARLAAAIEASCAARARRAALLPDQLDYPAELPVSAQREAIRAAIAEHQVVVVAGETGSGKTTQLPKICLELGRGVDGQIGHTQPRRLAARAVAARLAEELGTPLGDGLVGFQTRFQQRLGEDNLIKVMTDGILLAEIQQDRWLNRYDTLIIDEAHERSLNIDFLLGYLKRLLARRRDLKLIITSATLDVERMAAHFGDAPVITVQGRSYPVSIRYRPPGGAEGDEEGDLYSAIEQAVDELQAEGRGDVLVFLPGEREIREASRALRHRRGEFDILPLYARLPPGEQQRIFQPRGRTRIVLATNVAETSLTVPRIRYVIDSGLVRLSRYSWRSKIQRLPVEKVSRASADQRAGRCGRTAPGICIRLYAEDDFEQRPEFTDPEILRTNLAAVILQMQAMGLGEVEDFPFIDAPDPRLVRDGYRLLGELQAIDERRRLTPLGRQLARLPIDPRLGRMLLAARDTGALSEVLIIATALAVQDPRERPHDRREAADALHARFTDPRSDFLTLLRLWAYLEEKSEALSSSALRRLCQKEFLSHRRWREWHDLHRQLKLALAEQGLRLNTQPARYDAIHRALLAGLLDHIGVKQDKGEYQGCRNRRFHLFPGSALRAKPPKWVMAFEITETSRLYARTVAGIRPQWVETLGAHLLQHSVGEPHWQRRAARVDAWERLSLYGLVINPRRAVDYARVDPAGARELFIRHALVYGEWDSGLPVIAANQALMAELEEHETRTRRRDILVEEQVLFDFYDRLLPADVHSGAAFRRWYRRLPDAEILRLREEQLLRPEARKSDPRQLPSFWEQDGLRLPLRYHFAPGAADDGITLPIPLGLLPQIDADRCEWLVPGLLAEKLTALIKSLPKALRRHFVPAPDYARALRERLTPYAGPLLAAVTRELAQMTGVTVPADAWDLDRLPDHLRMRFEVLDGDGQVLAAGRDLAALRAQLAEASAASPPPPAQSDFEQSGLTRWPAEPLPEWVEVEEAGYSIRRYPALVDAGRHVDLRLLPDAEAAAAAHAGGVRRLLRLQLKDEIRYLDRHLPDMAQHCLRFAPLGDCRGLKDDLLQAALQHAFLDGQALPRSASEFEALLARGRPQLVPAATALAELLGELLPLWQDIRKRLKGNLPLSWIEAAADIRQQLDALIYPGFLLATPAARLRHLPRYLRAIQRRLDKLSAAPDRDRLRRVEIQPLVARFQALPAARQAEPGYAEYRWLLEELRVSLFAQELGTAEKVSPKRLERLWRTLAEAA